MYFRLNPECYFIKGDLTGAIYDLIEGDIYALSPCESRLIETCENNGEIDPADPFLRQLKERTVGNFYEKKVFIEKLRLGSPTSDYQPGKPPSLVRAFLEIGNRCSQSCWYCGRHGISRSMGCLGCNIWDEYGIPVDIERWKGLIDELHRLQCQALFIKGGNLAMVGEKTCRILEHAQGKFEKIFIIGHRNHFSEDLLDYLTTKGTLILQTDRISEVDTRNLCLLVSEYQKTGDLPARLPDNVILDIVSETFFPPHPESLLDSKRKIAMTNLEQFMHNNKLHPCLANSITITWSGEVLPCSMMRNYSLGNIRDRKIWTFLKGTEGSIQEFWKINLNTLNKCSKCEFRYVCTDCRALETAISGNLCNKVLCNYEPSKGSWHQPSA
jgi:radical SAM protein with 4Fe4S-binding SPASM domain